MSSSTETKWTKRWPRHVGYYWMWSPDLDDTFVVEVSGGAKGVPVVFYMSGEGPLARSYVEQHYGHSCEWHGPLEAPERETNDQQH
jgi:hypothetical protein